MSVSFRYDVARGFRVLLHPWFFVQAPGANVVASYVQLMETATALLLPAVMLLKGAGDAEEAAPGELGAASGGQEDAPGAQGGALAAPQSEEAVRRAKWTMLAASIALRSSHFLEWVGFLNYEVGASLWYSEGPGMSVLLNVIPPYMFR